MTLNLIDDIYINFIACELSMVSFDFAFESNSSDLQICNNVELSRNKIARTLK